MSLTVEVSPQGGIGTVPGAMDMAASARCRAESSVRTIWKGRVSPTIHCAPRNYFSANSLLGLQEAVQFRPPADLGSPLGSGRGQRSHRQFPVEALAISAYLTGVGGTKRMRLLGFERVELQPGESKEVTVSADPRRLARFDGKTGLGQWRIAAGTYRIALGTSAETSWRRRIHG